MGLIESAKDGILFLDEVGELPLQTQSKLLTALEERRFTRLGDTGAGHKIKNVKCCIDGIWNKESEEEWLTEIQLPIE